MRNNFEITKMISDYFIVRKLIGNRIERKTFFTLSYEKGNDIIEVSFLFLPLLEKKFEVSFHLKTETGFKKFHESNSRAILKVSDFKTILHKARAEYAKIKKGERNEKN